MSDRGPIIQTHVAHRLFGADQEHSIVRCPKCNAILEACSCYCGGYVPPPDHLAGPRWCDSAACPYGGEHFHFGCSRCGYAWASALASAPFTFLEVKL